MLLESVTTVNPNQSGLIVFSGSSNPRLSAAVCSILDTRPGRALVGRFSDGEVRVEVHESVRGMDTFIIQSTCPPANDHLMELLIMVDAVKRASPARVTAVLPYYGYGRQDQKEKPRVSITAKLVADLITASGADRVVALGLHADQLQGFFRIPVDHMYGTEILLEHMRREIKGDEIIVAPDAGGVERARHFASRLGIGLAITDHRQADEGDQNGYPLIVGDVKGRRVVILDDMIDTAKTMVRTARGALAAGAAVVDALCVHGVLSGQAMERLETCGLRSLTITDTIPHRQRVAESPLIRIVSVAPLLAEALRRLHNEESISALYGAC